MTIDVRTPEPTQVDEAFHALYLQPSAPRELVDAAFAVLASAGVTSDLREAYETILAAPNVGIGVRLPRQTSPWDLLHLLPDAPQCVLSAAYNIWRGDTEPIVIRPIEVESKRTAVEMVAATFRACPELVEGSPLAGDASDEPSLATSRQFISVFEEMSHELSSAPRGGEGSALLSNTDEHREDAQPQFVKVPPLPWGEGLGVRAEREELLYVAEEIEQHSEVCESSSPLPHSGEGSGVRAEHEELLDNAEEIEQRPSSPPRVEEGSAPALIDADGALLMLDHRPLRIGTQPSCDVVLRAAARIEARVWRNKGRVLVHALGSPGLVLVNGQSATWAVLTHGDTLAVGPASFSFRASKDT